VTGSGKAIAEHERRRGVGRTLLAGSGLALAVIALAGCGGSSKNSASDQTIRKDAALYQIDQIEQTWHKAASEHDVDLMMSLWAPGAVFNIGTKTLSGKAQIRHFFATENKAFMPQNHWESDTPSYKIKTTVHGDKGTLYFECHYVDVRTGKVVSVVGVDHNVQKINGKWLIVDSAGATPVLHP
jgi:ketosteroid isomerase-like protein